MNAYADAAATATLEPLNANPEQSLTVAEALQQALVNHTFNPVFNVQERRDPRTREAVAFGLALSLGTRTLNVTDCADVVATEGLTTRLDHYAVRAACRYMAEADVAPRMTVKVSAETLAQKGCTHLIEDAAASAGVRLDRLEIEIEEHNLHWRADIEPTLRHLNELGVRIAIDRFGTGLTSLSALSHLPIATIKIDESIVDNVMEDADVANYARAIVDAARQMRINVVVVGVASEEIEAFFERAGCLTFQRETAVDRLSPRRVARHRGQAIGRPEHTRR